MLMENIHLLPADMTLALLAPHHEKDAANVFTQTFCQYEPMVHYLGVTPKEFYPFAQQVIRNAIREQLSVVALKNNRIAAIAIVEDILANHEIHIENEKLQIIFAFLEHLIGNFYKQSRFQPNQVAHLFVTAVAPDALGGGLSKIINFAAMLRAREQGYQWMCGEFTNALNEKGTLKYIAKTAEKIASCQYHDFRYQGKQPFKHLAGGATAYLWQIRAVEL